MINENSTREEVLEAVRASGLLLRYASDYLKYDPEVVLIALRNNIDAFEHVGMGLRTEIVECWSKSVG